MSESSWNTAEMPALCASSRVVGRNGRSIEDDGARVRPDRPGEDLDERAFAGAVLAEQRMDLAGARPEVSTAQRSYTAKTLRNR